MFRASATLRAALLLPTPAGPSIATAKPVGWLVGKKITLFRGAKNLYYIAKMLINSQNLSKKRRALLTKLTKISQA